MRVDGLDWDSPGMGGGYEGRCGSARAYFKFLEIQWLIPITVFLDPVLTLSLIYCFFRVFCIILWS